MVWQSDKIICDPRSLEWCYAPTSSIVAGRGITMERNV